MRTSTKSRRVDDEEEFDPEIHDAAYYPKLVVRDGRGVRVRLRLTDAKPVMSAREQTLYDKGVQAAEDAIARGTLRGGNGSGHRPYTLGLTDAQKAACQESRDAWTRRLCDNDPNLMPPRFRDNVPNTQEEAVERLKASQAAYNLRLTEAWKQPFPKPGA